MRNKCDSCRTRLLIDPVGPLSAEILLVGDHPGYEEVRMGAPFVGKARDLLTTELARVGIQYSKCRSTNLWLHDVTTDCNLDYHVKMLIAEMHKKKYVLLMGSEVTKTLLNKGVMELSGLVVTSSFIPAEIKVVACPNPIHLLRGGRVGEVRMALDKFSRLVRGG